MSTIGRIAATRVPAPIGPTTRVDDVHIYSQITSGGEGGYGIPAIGRGGLGPTIATALVAFLQAGVVVAVQALLGSLGQVATVARALRDAAQP